MNSNAPLIFKKARGAFTLIEILIVMSLIVLLFGITSQLITSVGQSQGRSRARADLELIASGLEAFSGKFSLKRFFIIITNLTRQKFRETTEISCCQNVKMSI